MSNRFSRCYPLGDGNMCCEHHNGSKIVFPMRESDKQGKVKTAPVKKAVSTKK